MKCLTTIMGVAGMVVSCLGLVNAQTFTVQDGLWTSPSTWSGGVVPDSTHGIITLNHAISVSSNAVIVVDELVINNALTIQPGASLVISYSKKEIPDLQLMSGSLDVRGKLICKDTARIVGTNTSNTVFHDGSFYKHDYSASPGEPPQATWHVNSSLEVSKFTGNLSLTSAGWRQSFGNFIYDCPQQGNYVEFLGNVNDIKGNLHIKNTNGGILRLTLDRKTLNTINIGKDFIIEGNSEVWMSSNATTLVNVGGNFSYLSTATASSYITTGGNSTLNVEGDVIFDTPGRFRFASSAGGFGSLVVKGNLIFNNGLFAAVAPGQGVIECSGGVSQALTLAGTIESTIALRIANTSGVTLVINAVINGNLEVTSGVLELPERLTLNGNLACAEGTQLIHNNGTLSLTGTLPQTITVADHTLHNIQVNKPQSTVTLSGALNVSGTISIQSSGTDLISNGNLHLISLSDSGENDASVSALPANSRIVGDVTVQRFMSGEGRLYRYISSAVANASVASLQDDFPITGTFDDPNIGPGIRSTTPSFFYYDESLPQSTGWLPYPAQGPAADSPLIPGKGYSAFIRESNVPTVWGVKGELNQGEIDFNVTFTSNGTDDGWNLIGNPYASAIDWSSTMGWVKQNLEPGIAIRDNAAGVVWYWDGEIGSLGSGQIAKGQAVWVRTNGENPSLIINETAKTNTAASFLRTKTNRLDYVEIKVEGEQFSDRAYLRLRTDAINENDKGNVSKLSNDMLNLAFTVGGKELAISAASDLTCLQDLPLTLYFTSDSNGDIPKTAYGTYSFSINNHGLFNSSRVYLVDKYKGEDFDITQSTYLFEITSDTSSQNKRRFALRFEASPLNALTHLSADSILCDQRNVPITLSNTTKNVLYTVLVNGKEAALHWSDEEGNHRFDLDHSIFTKSKNDVDIIEKSACHQRQFHHTISKFLELIITEERGILKSSHKTGNRWYYNRDIVPIDTSDHLIPQASGKYTLVVSNGHCLDSTTYDYVLPLHHVTCYPNPVDYVLYIKAPRNETLKHISFVSASGIKLKTFDIIESVEGIHLTTSSLPSGLYTVEVMTDKSRSVTKIVKK